MQKKLLAVLALPLMASALWAQKEATDSISMKGELEEIVDFFSSIFLANLSKFSEMLEIITSYKRTVDALRIEGLLSILL